MSGGGLGVNTLVMLDTVQDEETLFDSSIHFSNHFQLIFTYPIDNRLLWLREKWVNLKAECH